MTDFRDLRARLREGHAAPASDGLGNFNLLIFALCGIALGFAAVLFWPRVEPLTPSNAIRTFDQVRGAIEAGEKPPKYIPLPLPPNAGAPTSPTLYAGKSAGAIAKIADDVCFKRAHARVPHWSKTPRLTTKELSAFRWDELEHFNELLHCLITEAPARYCASRERRMIGGEIDMYFRGVAHAIGVLDQEAARIANVASDFADSKREYQYELARARAGVEPDPRVVNAIEQLARAGYLTKANREQLAANAPRAIRERLARVEPRPSPCPQQPWWAFWR